MDASTSARFHTIAFRFLLDHPLLLDKWQFQHLSANRSLTIDIVTNPKYKDKTWDWDELSTYETIPIEDICNHPTLPWDWDHISQRRATYKMLKKYPHLPWRMHLIGKMNWIRHESFQNRVTSYDPPPHDFITQIADQPWVDWAYMSWCDVSARTIEQYIDKPWRWDSLSCSETLTFDFVLRHLDKPWNWQNLSGSHIISIEDVLSHPHLPWDWEAISKNSRLVTKVYRLHHAAKRIQRQWRAHHKLRTSAANLIKRQWRQAISNPTYTLCITRLQREFAALNYSPLTLSI